MHLKSLTLRGFKSFASATTLAFEPGITAVVGPNGSGKSNVVDALAWVMGEQGAKSLRGGKMEDVIFAGTTGRPPLGRAEVVLTIDNADGALPIPYSEVTISRTLFRSGASEYAINGEGCRLLDVQELLADSGIGREMHVIVGQGQLDAVLAAGPAELRGMIEEAAGVLKHRKRKDKALRKLDAMSGNLTRLTDLAAELRRQLGPLGRQAEMARRASSVAAQLRDARLRLLADDLAGARTALAAEVADEDALRAARAQVEAAAAAVAAEVASLEAEQRALEPAARAAADTYYRLTGLAERLDGTASLAAERRRHAGETPEPTTGPDPDALEAEAAAAREALGELEGELAAQAAALEAASAARSAAAARATAAEEALTAELRARADRREGRVRLAGQRDAAHRGLAARQEEAARLGAAVAQARARADAAESEFTALESQVAGLDAGEVDLDGDYERAAAALADVVAQIESLQAAERDAERDRAAARARMEALELGMARRDGAAALLAASPPTPGLLGSVTALLAVRPGYEAALAAALGDVADAVVVDSDASAAAALAALKAADAGRASLVVTAGAPPVGAVPAREALAALAGAGVDVEAAVDLVEAGEGLAGALSAALAGVVVAADLAAAQAVRAAAPQLVVVTRAGDLLGPGRARGGSATQPSLLEVQAALEQARADAATAAHAQERARFALTAAQAQREAAQAREADALARLHQSDAELAAVAERLGQLGAAARAAGAEADRLAAALAATEAAVAGDAETVQRLDAVASQAPPPAEDDADPDTAERDALVAAAEAARAAEVDARLAVRTTEERMRALAGRAESLGAAAAAERDARERARARTARLALLGARAAAVSAALGWLRAELEGSLAEAARARDETDTRRAGVDAALRAARLRGSELAEQLEQLTDSVHRDEVARTEQRLRIQAMAARAVEEYGVDADTLVAEYGPDVPVPVLATGDGGDGPGTASAPAAAPVAAPDGDDVAAGGPPTPGASTPDDSAGEGAQAPATVPYVRAEQEKRARSAERALAQLGRVNPLALEEYAALQERQQYLATQLEDLRKTRRDLLAIVAEVDERVQEVFTAAFADTAAAFEQVFPRLFPGGEGRLVLSDPADLLATGVEVAARPAGKAVRRLSLLSGGERSLVGLAVLVSIFQARPSPFYVLDEVEAALDDANLGRLLGLLEELRASSQLLIITHQKRTMEIADALYGVSMRGDGVSAVISQRLRETQPA